MREQKEDEEEEEEEERKEQTILQDEGKKRRTRTAIPHITRQREAKSEVQRCGNGSIPTLSQNLRINFVENSFHGLLC